MKKYYKIIIIILVVGVLAFLGYRFFLKKEKKGPVAEPTATVQTEKFKVFVKEKGGLNLRKNPSTDGEILLTMPFRAEVEVEKEEGDWYFGTYQDKSGYFKKEFVSQEKPKDDTLDWQSYTNELQSFNFKFPGDWAKTVDENKNDGQMYNDYTKIMVENKQIAGSPYFMLLVNPPAFGLENFSKEISREEITIGGIKAEKLIAEEDSEITPKPQRAIIISFKRTATNDNYYLLLGNFKAPDVDFSSTFENILASFKFL